MRLLVLHESGITQFGKKIMTKREIQIIDIPDEIIRQCHQELDKIFKEGKGLK